MHDDSIVLLAKYITEDRLQLLSVPFYKHILTSRQLWT